MGGEYTEVSPTKTYEHEWGGLKTKILLFGKPNNFLSLVSNTAGLDIITGHAREHGVLRVFAPRVTSASKMIVDKDCFTKVMICNGRKVSYGIDADGVLIPSQSAFFIAPADCPTLVLQSSEGKMVATHAGRNCLLDDGLLSGNTTHPGVESVVYEGLKLLRCNPQKIYASIFCGIGEQYFIHPIEGTPHQDKNEQLIKYVCKRWGRKCFGPNLPEGQLNLFELISMQLREAGVQEKNIWHDGACTYSDLISKDKPMWWSHRRGDKGRNGVLVMRLN
ncbi:MAG: laccase domain-containing protein [Parcubacteria group bacterium]|nr:laccase domain-containing protein [Parcubacteria group bacterium]